MSGNLIKIGLTGIIAHQTALSTTGNNVTNANTPGYSRQQVSFDTNPSYRTGGGYLGSGVSITSIKRISSEYLVNQLRLDSTTHAEYETLLGYLQQVDNLLSNESTGLSAGINKFFSALQGAAEDPSALPERTLLLSETEGLISRFNTVQARFDQLGYNANQELTTLTAQVNTLAKGIAEVNSAIVAARGTGAVANELLDKRDELLRQLSEIVSVSVVDQSDGRINVFIGKGQPLVSGGHANRLELQASESDPNRLEMLFNENGVRHVVTSQINGGKMGGILYFRDQVLPDAQNQVGRLALNLAEQINSQHRLGLTLENKLGGNFFTDINSREAQLGRVIANARNAPPADRIVAVEITDSTRLEARDYELRFTGPSNGHYSIVDKASGQVMSQGMLGGQLPDSIEFGGLRIHLESGSFQAGDRFLLTPTRNAASELGLSVQRPEDIALASPVRAEASLGNTGSAKISAGTMLGVKDVRTGQLLEGFRPDGQYNKPLVIRFITDNVYEILDNSDPANPRPLQPPMTNQIYTGGSATLFSGDPGETMVRAGGDGSAIGRVNLGTNNGYGSQVITLTRRDPATGVVSSTTLPATAPNASARQIADMLNQQPGVSANAYTDMRISGIASSGMTLSINGEELTVPEGKSYEPDALAEVINNNGRLKDMGIYAVSDGVSLRLRSSTGDDITVEVAGTGTVQVSNPSMSEAPIAVAAGGSATVGGFLDVTLADGVSLSADNNNLFSQIPRAESTFKGFQFSITGQPKKGDTFTIGFNADGTSDNGNAMAMLGLGTRATMGNGATFTDAYGQLVERVGTLTNQTMTDKEAAQSLLRQSENSWESLSGVNLDEEAGKLIQFQAAYNASAKVMSMAQDLFNTLISSFR